MPSSEMPVFGTAGVAKNASEFSKQLMGMADYMSDGFELALKKTIIDLYRSIVKMTPRDTGRAAASWGLSVEGGGPKTLPPESGWPKKDFSKSFRNSKVQEYANKEISGFSFGIESDRVIISNNMEYIKYLENGTSEQAPYGMVSVSLIRFQHELDQNMRAIIGVK